jgi:XRE family transcriptional regulator, aerobic/anaerobic benzoate catabolism transcriptional regulator
MPMDDLDAQAPRSPFLSALGERVRALRARRAMSRRALAQASDVSERHLANLELGVGNASVLVLLQVARALDCQIEELLGDESTTSPEWLLIRELLRGRSEDELRRGRIALADLYGTASRTEARTSRIALVGLRGAGKSTLGRLLAAKLELPFVELNHEIARIAGCDLNEIHNLMGAVAYRRYELRALRATLERHSAAVIATPGGLVTEPASYNLLLAHCYTVWLTATPEQHMERVLAQGDLRPMADNPEAMADLKRILAERQPFYDRADMVFDTAAADPEAALAVLSARLGIAIGSNSGR